MSQATLPNDPLGIDAGPPQARGLELRVVASGDPQGVGRSYVLDAASLVFGRGEGAAPRLADARMSRRHAELGLEGDRAWVRDLGARNGVFVNGHQVHHVALSAGDTVRLGDTLLVVQRHVDDRGIGDAARALVGDSPAIRRLRSEVCRVARTDLHVLVCGETGAGKELVASELHRLSGRRGELVAVNCAAIPETLAESTLFGHVRGAFTGASGDRAGVFEQAHHGTLLLDEIGELAGPLQAKLLRVLEDGVVTRVGGDRARRTDVRVVAATNRDVAEAVEAGDFRRDLHARLAEWEITPPALRERRGDVLQLLATLLGDGGAVPVHADAAEALVLWDWPSNVRELRALARRVPVLVEGEEQLLLAHLPDAVREGLARRRAGAAGAEPAVAEVPPELSRENIEAALAEATGNVTRAARALGVSRRTLYRHISQHAIDPTGFREGFDADPS